MKVQITLTQDQVNQIVVDELVRQGFTISEQTITYHSYRTTAGGFLHSFIQAVRPNGDCVEPQIDHQTIEQIISIHLKQKGYSFDPKFLLQKMGDEGGTEFRFVISSVSQTGEPAPSLAVEPICSKMILSYSNVTSIFVDDLASKGFTLNDGQLTHACSPRVGDVVSGYFEGTDSNGQEVELRVTGEDVEDAVRLYLSLRGYSFRKELFLMPTEDQQFEYWVFALVNNANNQVADQPAA